MSSKTENLIKQYKAAFQRLEDVMGKKKDEYIRDSAIQRFEFTFELAWKSLKSLLEDKGVKDLYSPKDVLKAAFQNGAITNDVNWIKMVETRNKTSHVYNEKMADEVYSEISGYLKLFNELALKI